jgi:hypothetical protein
MALTLMWLLTTSGGAGPAGDHLMNKLCPHGLIPSGYDSARQPRGGDIRNDYEWTR